MAKTSNRLVIDEDKIAESLNVFEDTAQLLSSDDSKLIDHYSGKWIGLHSGEVRVSGDSFHEVLEALDEAGWSREEAIVRLIEKDPSAVIL